MEMKMSGSGEAAPGASGSAGCKKRPPSRLQKHAPASLQLEQDAAAAPGATAPGTAAAWGDGRAPIPLLSPLVVSPTATPTPVWEADQAKAASGARREGDAEGRCGGGEQLLLSAARHAGADGERQPHDAGAGAGWRHPALPTPLAEPAALVPLFQSQCALEVRGAQQ